MTRFYRRALVEGERPAAALRAAQVEMWKDKRWESPYYWAAFTMQMAQALQIYQMLCQMDPSACRMMQSMFIEMEPMLEQQIYAFARQLSD